MFEKMPHREVTELGNCLRGVMEKAAAGSDPAAELARVAVDKNLPLEKVARLCEAYNKAVSVKEICSRPCGMKGDDINLLDMSKVASLITGGAPESEPGLSTAIPDLSRVDLEKMASNSRRELMKEANKDGLVSVTPMSPASMYTRRWNDRARKEASERNAAMDFRTGVEGLKDGIQQLADRLRSDVRFVAKHAADVSKRHGRDGELLLKLACAMARLDDPVFEGHGAPLPIPGTTGSMIEKIMEKRAGLAKEAFLSLPLSLGKYMPEFKTETGKEVDDYEISATGRKYRKIDSELSEELARVDKLRQALSLYRGEPFFQGRPLSQILEAFDFTTEQMPHIHPIRDRAAFTTIMKKKMQAGEAGLDEFALAQIRGLDEATVTARKELAQTSESEAKDRDLRMALSKRDAKDMDLSEMINPLVTGGTSAVKGMTDAAVETFKTVDEKLKAVDEHLVARKKYLDSLKKKSQPGTPGQHNNKLNASRSKGTPKPKNPTPPKPPTPTPTP